MFAKLSAVGHTREEALGRLKRALAESAIAIKGGTTNRTFLLQLLDRDEVRAARVDVGWLDRLSAPAGGRAGRPCRHRAAAGGHRGVQRGVRGGTRSLLLVGRPDEADLPARSRPPGGGRVPWPPLPVPGLPAGDAGVPNRGSGHPHRPERRAARAVRAVDHPWRPPLPRAVDRPGLHAPRRGGRHAAPHLARRCRHRPRAGPGHRGRRRASRRATTSWRPASGWRCSSR